MIIIRILFFVSKFEKKSKKLKFFQNIWNLKIFQKFQNLKNFQNFINSKILENLKSLKILQLLLTCSRNFQNNLLTSNVLGFNTGYNNFQNLRGSQILKLKTSAQVSADISENAPFVPFLSIFPKNFGSEAKIFGDPGSRYPEFIEPWFNIHKMLG